MRGPLFGRGSGRLLTLFVLSSLVMVVGVLVPSVASAAECTDTWVGPAEGPWTTAADWSAKHVPTKSDVACIESGSSVAIFSGSQVVGAVQGEAAFVSRARSKSSVVQGESESAKSS